MDIGSFSSNRSKPWVHSTHEPRLKIAISSHSENSWRIFFRWIFCCIFWWESKVNRKVFLRNNSSTTSSSFIPFLRSHCRSSLTNREQIEFEKYQQLHSAKLYWSSSKWDSSGNRLTSTLFHRFNFHSVIFLDFESNLLRLSESFYYRPRNSYYVVSSAFVWNDSHDKLLRSFFPSNHTHFSEAVVLRKKLSTWMRMDLQFRSNFFDRIFCALGQSIDRFNELGASHQSTQRFIDR